MSSRIDPHCVLLVVAGLVWAAGGNAQSVLQSTGDASIGWTDNARSAPDEPVADIEAKEADGFVILSPGLALAFGSPRVIQLLTYTYSANLYFRDVTAGTSSHQLAYRAFFELTPRSSLLLGARLTQTRPYASRLLVPASQSELTASIPSTGAFIFTSVDELYSIDLSPDWRAWQGAGFGLGSSLLDDDAPTSTETAVSLGAERAFRHDAVGVEARGAYSTVEGGVSSTGASLGTQRQLVLSGVGIWRHDFGRDFTSRADAGVVRVQRLSSGLGFWHPTGSAVLAYAVEAGQGELGYSHRVTTNLLLGQSLLVDEVHLSGGVPLTRQRELLLGASIGYQSGRLIEEDATLAARLKLFMADAGIGWQVSPGVLAGLRYQHVRQISDAELPPLPLSYVRNTALLTVALRFPPDSSLPRPYRRPRRVDRSDEVREGVSDRPWWEDPVGNDPNQRRD